MYKNYRIMNPSRYLDRIQVAAVVFASMVIVLAQVALALAPAGQISFGVRIFDAVITIAAIIILLYYAALAQYNYCNCRSRLSHAAKVSSCDGSDGCDEDEESCPDPETV